MALMLCKKEMPKYKQKNLLKEKLITGSKETS
jgi:hypothetical protein